MFFDETDEVERWWNTGKNKKFPGKCAIVVGAGISMDAPTGLPNGVALTQAVLKHMLSEDAAKEILSVFEQCAPILVRAIPRLEHVLDKTCNSLEGEEILRAGNPREILRLFSGKPSNANHRGIADYLLSNRGWCITTNFDDCIERASGYKIPVHVMNATHSDVDLLHAEFGTDWGLIKLHGTIENGVDALAATLADLQLGLPPPMRDLLNRVMDEVDAFIVAGYSGTDHFDINHWIRERANWRRDAPKLIWISHDATGNTEQTFDENKEPHVSWASAFAGTATKAGITGEILAELLGVPADSEPAHATNDMRDLPLEEELRRLYVPKRSEKHLNGARLAASIGLGQLAEEELRQCRHVSRDENAATSIDPDIYFVRGMKQEALEVRMALDHAGIPAGAITRTRLLRHQGKQLQAVWRFMRLAAFSSRGAEKIRTGEAIEALACTLDVIEILQKRAVFRTRFARRLCASALAPLWRRAMCNRTALPISSQGKAQTQSIRLMALLEDDDEVRPMLGELWQLVHDQYSRPDFYTENGPLIPGYHLIEQSTAREEDRLADLVEVNLEMAGILLAAIRRRWPCGIEDVWKEMEREGRYAVRSDFSVGQLCATVIVDLLFDAQRIATALREHSLHVTISKHWVKAERILGGVSYWKQQRLYLPSTPIHADT